MSEPGATRLLRVSPSARLTAANWRRNYCDRGASDLPSADGRGATQLPRTLVPVAVDPEVLHRLMRRSDWRGGCTLWGTCCCGVRRGRSMKDDNAPGHGPDAEERGVRAGRLAFL